MRATDCSPGMFAADNCAAPDAEQAAQAMVTPCEAVKTAGGESWRVAAAWKKAILPDAIPYANTMYQ